jgi:2-polyprenyl-3-methyl-5-hydroxy-6-metoxy-1,4-benzoquinol methylase/spore coat polysaccharide biosynthesis predicted glycosyltransferase SpsG
MTTNDKHSLLVIPACEPGRGGGHLVRCVALVRDLRALGREAWLYITSPNADAVLDTVQFDRAWLLAENGLREKSWQCIILDRFHTPARELARWQEIAPVIGIDEGGKHRNYFDFLIDILPNCFKIPPNIADPSLLPLPKIKPYLSARSETESLKVLLSFGLEDSAGLGPALAKTLVNHQNIEITLLQGKQSQGKKYTSLKNPIPNLNEHLTDYDLIVTHYGLTSFEALYAGVPVLLASPTAYHEKLAKQAGFWTLGIGKKNAVKKLNVLLRKNEAFFPYFRGLKKHCVDMAIEFGLDREFRQSLASLVNGFAPDVNRSCPVCGAALDGPVLARFSERNYIRCKYCGVISMNRINPLPVEYYKEYFFEQYQKQYGKTYIEDFPNLTAMAKHRLSVIRKVGSNGMAAPPWGIGSREKTREGQNKLSNDDPCSPSLLDIGCAYGAFLAAAQEEGYVPHGIDPAEDAVRYVTQIIGIHATQGYFPTPDSRLSTPDYKVITLWYVIEHFRDCVPALAEIRKLLKPGGVLAFATPSFTGISGRKSLKHFLKNSPQDHRTVWSPSVCVKSLGKTGFRVKRIISSGHHPERFPFLGKFARNRNSPLYRLLLAASRIFALGDTMEVYAVKEN